MAKKAVVQPHHISYGNKETGELEEVVKIYKGEHWAITQLNRRTKNISQGFLRCLQKFIDDNKDMAVDLEEDGD